MGNLLRKFAGDGVRTVLVSGATIVALAISAAVAGTWAVIARSQAHIVAPEAAPPRDVAIVLGAGLARPGVPGPVLADRLQVALDLYEAGRVQKILVSGDNDGRGHDEVNPMRSWLVDHGVASADVYMDHAGFRTLDTMQRAARIFDVENAIICTQSFHLPRSVYLARSAGIDAIGVAAPQTRWSTTKTARVREVAAWGKAVIDVTIGLGPRHLGVRIPIASSPATATHDSNT